MKKTSTFLLVTFILFMLFGLGLYFLINQPQIKQSDYFENKFVGYSFNYNSDKYNVYTDNYANTFWKEPLYTINTNQDLIIIPKEFEPNYIYNSEIKFLSIASNPAMIFVDKECRQTSELIESFRGETLQVNKYLMGDFTIFCYSSIVDNKDVLVFQYQTKDENSDFLAISKSIKITNETVFTQATENSLYSSPCIVSSENTSCSFRINISNYSTSNLIEVHRNGKDFNFDVYEFSGDEKHREKLLGNILYEFAENDFVLMDDASIYVYDKDSYTLKALGVIWRQSEGYEIALKDAI